MNLSISGRSQILHQNYTCEDQCSTEQDSNEKVCGIAWETILETETHSIAEIQQKLGTDQTSSFKFPSMRWIQLTGMNQDLLKQMSSSKMNEIADLFLTSLKSMFPNDAIALLINGNYQLKVVEQQTEQIESKQILKLAAEKGGGIYLNHSLNEGIIYQKRVIAEIPTKATGVFLVDGPEGKFISGFPISLKQLKLEQAIERIVIGYKNGSLSKADFKTLPKELKGRFKRKRTEIV